MDPPLSHQQPPPRDPDSHSQHSQRLRSQSPAQTPSRSQSYQSHHSRPDFPDYNEQTTDADTAANTAANASTGSQHNDLSATDPQSQQTQGRFTEEWDAAQRGTSIIDGDRSSTMQRSNSVHSFNAGDDHQLPTRGNTLKKKNSMRRNRSLKRSNSRRSMRAGSVKSLALDSTSDPDAAHNAFHCPVPTRGNPTELLADRFQGMLEMSRPLASRP